MAKKVSIITINYNGKDDTVDLIESFGRYETYPYEIIIIDNGSKNHGEHRVLSKYSPKPIVIRSDKNPVRRRKQPDIISKNRVRRLLYIFYYYYLTKITTNISCSINTLPNIPSKSSLLFFYFLRKQPRDFIRRR